MTLEELKAAHAAKLAAARALRAKLTDTTPAAEARQIERDFDLALAEADELRNRIEDARAGDNRGDPRRPMGFTGSAATVENANDPHLRAFTDWLRRPASESARSALSSVESRAASSLTGAAGGFVVPEQIVTPILARVRNGNPFRRLARVVRVSSGDVKFPISNGDATSGWVGETDTRTATTEPTLASKAPTFGTAYANVTMTEELMQDAAVDIEEWFVEECGRAMAEAEMQAIISGNGDDKPTGLLHVAPESAADGSRTANALRYIASGAADTLGTAAADLLLTTYYDLKAEYRGNATWLMNSKTASAIRKLKAGDGNYLWTDTLSAGQPATLLGHPVAIAEGMADIGTNAHPILFGDFRRGYVLAERTEMAVLADPYTVKGSVSLYLRYRIGGIVYDENAIRAIKCAAS